MKVCLRGLDYEIQNSLLGKIVLFMSFFSSRQRRLFVRVRTHQFTVPFLFLLIWILIVIGLSQVADTWIVALAACPIVFALIITLLCLWAYRKDFYA